MEKLGYKYATALKAGQALNRVIQRYTKNYHQATDEEREDYTASLIKHFELFYGSLWKLFKFYLLHAHGIETVGSKDVFKAAFDKKLITQDQLDMLLSAVEIRNETTHVYDENFAEEISDQIVSIYGAMQALLDSIKNNI